jgi:carbon-monoxide dehydrogenase medium subunit
LFETALGPHDLLTAIRVPAAGADTRIGFAEFARRHGDYALAGLAACARATADGLREVRLAFFGLGATALRARGAEVALAGGALDAARIDAAVAALAHDLDPTGDVHASAAMKRHLASVLLRRVARQLAEPPP